MKVTFTRNEGLDSRATQGAGPLKPGKEYIVLEVFSVPGRNTRFRMEHSPHPYSCGMFDNRLFTVTSAKIPPSWIYCQLEGGAFSLRPEPWNAPGFWEAFFDGEPWAVTTYESEKNKILAAS